MPTDSEIAAAWQGQLKQAADYLKEQLKSGKLNATQKLIVNLKLEIVNDNIQCLRAVRDCGELRTGWGATPE